MPRTKTEREMLEALIREQADEMRFERNRVRRQGEKWMNTVFSLDAVQMHHDGGGGRTWGDSLSNQGPAQSRPKWSCPIHNNAHSGLDSWGRPLCFECHRDSMRRYAASPKGKARTERYLAKPGVRDNRNEKQRFRKWAKREGIELPDGRSKAGREAYDVLYHRWVGLRSREQHG